MADIRARVLGRGRKGETDDAEPRQQAFAVYELYVMRPTFSLI